MPLIIHIQITNNITTLCNPWQLMLVTMETGGCHHRSERLNWISPYKGPSFEYEDRHIINAQDMAYQCVNC